MNTFLYDAEGSTLSDVGLMTTAVDVPANVTNYVSAYCELFILYGNYIGAGGLTNPPSIMEPSVLPSMLPYVKGKVKLFFSNGEPYAEAELISAEDLLLYDTAASPSIPSDKIVGAKLTFRFPQFEGSDVNEYIARWEFDAMTINYGGDKIKVPGKVGVSGEFTPDISFTPISFTSWDDL